MSKSTLIVDTKQIQKNIELLRKDKEICIVVKANAYGMGYDIISEYEKLGCYFFAVTVIEEAFEVRKRSKTAKILILSEIEIDELQDCMDNNFSLSVGNLNYLKVVANKVDVHLKFDVSMGRTGFLDYQIDDLFSYIQTNEVKISGLLTHFACALDETITLSQIERFRLIYEQFKVFDPKYVHCQNTVASLKYDVDFCNMVRPGIGVLGLFATKTEAQKIGITLHEAVTLNAKVLQEKEFTGPISYDYTQNVSGHVKTLRLGYYDGIDRKLQGFKSNDYEIVGRVCMCQLHVLANEKHVDVIEIFGKNTSIYTICEYLDKIVYEVLVSLSSRIKREYI